MNRYFHFTLGPVQGFVAQARRTRDFWAGSFLLSYLAGVAMLEVKKQRGEIEFPEPDTNYLHWLEIGKGPSNRPEQGNIPNRFLAKVPDDFRPKAVKKAVKTAWRELATSVWQRDLEGLAGPETRKIWDRQIDGFWEIAWALVDDDEKDSTVLDRRKNWRSHYIQPEPGLKCMMMEGMQELSAAERPGGADAFWNRLRHSDSKAIETDLRENERLCAIAYVKRRFVHYFEGFTAVMPSAWTAHGWTLASAVPSVTLIAGIPWLQMASERAGEHYAGFLKAAARFSEVARMQRSEIRVSEFGELDGHVFFEADLRNEKLYPDRDHANIVLEALHGCRKAAGLPPPAPYYALLLMDGDALGKHLGDEPKRGLISKALKTFTGRVQSIVECEHDGFLVYAGGDDVLALLTLDSALPCAEALRDAYGSAFEAEFAKDPAICRFPATISASIQYAHYRLPFTRILADAHQLLDDVAKDGRGRDAVAVRVWKQSGLHLTWAQPWQIALKHGGISDLVGKLRGKTEEEARVAAGFFYRMRELFNQLAPSGEGAEGFSDADMAKLLSYDYQHSGIHDNGITPSDAAAFIRPLLDQCCPRMRDPEQDSQHWPRLSYSADAALLVRFLASRGAEH